MGEPTINGTYKWESDTVQQLDPDTVVWLKISNNINGSAFIRIDPVVPKRGEWGFNVTGSPNWNKVLVSQYEGNKAIKYVDAAIAKQFWGNGFQVVEVDVENGQLLLEAEHGSKKTSTTYSHYSYTITLTPNPNILNVKKVMRYKDDKPKPKTVTFQLTRI